MRGERFEMKKPQDNLKLVGPMEVPQKSPGYMRGERAVVVRHHDNLTVGEGSMSMETTTKSQQRHVIDTSSTKQTNARKQTSSSIVLGEDLGDARFDRTVVAKRTTAEARNLANGHMTIDKSMESTTRQAAETKTSADRSVEQKIITQSMGAKSSVNQSIILNDVSQQRQIQGDSSKFVSSSTGATTNGHTSSSSMEIASSTQKQSSQSSVQVQANKQGTREVQVTREVTVTKKAAPGGGEIITTTTTTRALPSTQKIITNTSESRSTTEQQNQQSSSLSTQSSHQKVVSSSAQDMRNALTIQQQQRQTQIDSQNLTNQQRQAQHGSQIMTTQQHQHQTQHGSQNMTTQQQQRQTQHGSQFVTTQQQHGQTQHGSQIMTNQQQQRQTQHGSQIMTSQQQLSSSEQQLKSSQQMTSSQLQQMSTSTSKQVSSSTQKESQSSLQQSSIISSSDSKALSSSQKQQQLSSTQTQIATSDRNASSINITGKGQDGRWSSRDEAVAQGKFATTLRAGGTGDLSQSQSVSQSRSQIYHGQMDNTADSRRFASSSSAYGSHCGLHQTGGSSSVSRQTAINTGTITKTQGSAILRSHQQQQQQQNLSTTSSQQQPMSEVRLIGGRVQRIVRSDNLSIGKGAFETQTSAKQSYGQYQVQERIVPVKSTQQSSISLGSYGNETSSFGSSYRKEFVQQQVKPCPAAHIESTKSPFKLQRETSSHRFYLPKASE